MYGWGSVRQTPVFSTEKKMEKISYFWVLLRTLVHDIIIGGASDVCAAL